MTWGYGSNILGLIGNLFSAVTTFSASIAHSGLTIGVLSKNGKQI